MEFATLDKIQEACVPQVQCQSVLPVRLKTGGEATVYEFKTSRPSQAAVIMPMIPTLCSKAMVMPKA